MANVTQSLFGFTPQDLQAQRDAEMQKQALQFAKLSPMESARVGLFQGVNQLGNAIGGALGYEDPEMAQARARQGLLGGMDINDPKALRDAAKSTNDPQVQLFLADRALEIEKAIAEANRKKQGGSGVGTGVERMIQHIVKVEEDEAAGNQVSVADKNKAKYFRMQLSQVKTYKMPDDTIITISVKDFTGQQDAEAAGGVPVDVQAMLPVSGTTPSTSPPTTTTAPTTGQKTPGVRVTETPASQAAKEKAEEGKRQKQVVFESDIGQIDKALEIVRSKGRLAAGAGSLLSFIPESSASELADTIQSIDAGKLINQIESLKTTSPSGATGFGSLTEQEGQRLINRLGSIKQTKSPQKLEEALLEVRTLLGKLAGKELPPPRGSSQSLNANQEAVIKKLMDANPGKTRESIIQFAKSKKLI
jgi:hypothetical protein